MRGHCLFVCTVLACTGEKLDESLVMCGTDALTRLDRLYGLPPFEFAGRGIQWVGDSAWVVLDEDDMQGVVVGRQGAEQMRFGGEGGGPGEFRAVSSVLVDPDSGYLVAGYGRLSHFGFDGALRNEVSLPGMISALLFWDGVKATAAVVDMMRGPVIVAADLSTETHLELFAPISKDASLKSEVIPGLNNNFLPIAGSRDGIIVVGSVEEYRLTRFDREGNLTGALGRPELGVQYRTEKEKADLPARLRELYKDLPEVQSVLPDFAKMFEDNPKRPFVTVTFDSDGYLWLAAEVVTDSSRFDLLNPAGRFVGSLWLPHKVLALGFNDDKVAVLFETAGGAFDGQHAIDVYRFEISDCAVETLKTAAP